MNSQILTSKYIKKTNIFQIFINNCILFYLCSIKYDKKMKRILILVIVVFVSIGILNAQKVYDESKDGEKQLLEAIQKAKQENKYVFAMVGGNWCKWCLMFDEFATTNQNVKKTLEDNFVFVHINYSKANENPKAMKQMGYPERFGFPVFVILNEKGERVHTQNSAYLEQGEGYSEKEVVSFLNLWTKKAVEEVPKK